LALHVEVTVEDPVALDRLAYVSNQVDQPEDDALRVRVAHRLHVAGTGPWELAHEGDLVGRYHDLESVLYVLYQRCYGRAVEQLALAGWQSLHGGLATVGERRVLVVGDKGAGKTTLMLRLLADGHAVEGDESVLTRNGLAVALPRRFHVKPGTAAMVPELAGAMAEAPRAHLSDGTPIVGFDPVVAGFPAATRLAPVDLAVVLRPGAEGEGGWHALSTIDTVRAVVERALPTTDSRPALLAACAALLGHVPGVALDRGELAATRDDLLAAVNASNCRQDL
jgi:hypothetical protein